ncbi:hypothetical protein AAFF_G00367210 [Aldrovandia affinis]|uniref:Uncharacterized protein n=1 Tax=Aldrovandia affinis TaxID=143900 RepID=A0AAD7SHJ3_9TELE|nr:hypothetical protein AAFF_G00367210 [Aldrovandia affinis]
MQVLYQDKQNHRQEVWRMSKIERLNASVAQLLAVAVHEVLDVVGQAVSEYQEETARTQRENESLKRRLRELQEVVKRVSTGTAHPLSLSASEGRSPVEQQHCDQEWGSSLREDTELTTQWATWHGKNQIQNIIMRLMARPTFNQNAAPLGKDSDLEK